MKTLNFLLILLCFFQLGCTSKSDTEKALADVKKDSANALNSAAFKKVNAALKENPSDPDLYYRRGELYLAIKDFEAAIADAERALKIDSLKNDTYYILLTDAYFYSDKTRKAKETLERCVKNIPGSKDGFLKLAELYFFVKKYQECIVNLNSALKIDEHVAKAYFIKGMCYKETGDTSLAISSMQTACEQDDKYYDAYVETGRLLAAKKSTLCIEYYNNALRLNPKSTEVVYLVGKFYQDTKRIPQAIDAYNKLLTMNKADQHALYNLGVIQYVFLKDLPKAKEYFTKAIDADAQYAEAYLARGICYNDEKNYSEAEADYRSALQYRPNFEPAVERLNALTGKKK